MGVFVLSPLPPVFLKPLQPNSRAPWLPGRYTGSSLLRTRPRPSRRPPTSRCFRLYGFPAPPISRRDEEGFSSCLARPCHRTAPNTPPKCLAASGSCDDPCALRPVSGGSAFGANFSRPPVGSLALRSGDLLTILKMALSIGYRSSVVGI